MAAIPDTGGARYAPRGVMRALLRLLVLGGLLAAGWLLGSGTGHADDDLWQPGTRPFHLVNVTAADDSADDQFRVDDQFGVSPSVGSVVQRVLSTTSAPGLSAQPPVQVGVLRPVVKAAGVAKPLTKVLTPVVRPRSGPAPYRAATPPPAQPDRVASVLPTAPAVPAFSPAHEASPRIALSSPAEGAQAATTSPAEGPAAEAAADPVRLQTVSGGSPVTPIPAGLPGSTMSPCMIGGSGGGTSGKNPADVAVRDGWTMGNLSQPHDGHPLDTSDLPRSLSEQPSTSPD